MIKKSGISAAVGLLGTCLMVMATLFTMPMNPIREYALASLALGIPLISYGAGIFLSTESNRRFIHACIILVIGSIAGVLGISIALYSISSLAGLIFVSSSFIMVIISWFYRRV